MKESYLHIIKEELENPDVIEIIANADGKLWIDTHKKGMFFTGKTLKVQEREIFLRIVASKNKKNITPISPSLSAKIYEYNARLQGEICPVVSAPIFTIRKPTKHIITLQEYVDAKIIPKNISEFLENEFLKHKTIIISGGTQSGKTRLANAFLNTLKESSERIYIIEDTPELVCEASNNICMLVNDIFTYQNAVKSSLRHRPDRIIVGEVRDCAALDLLKAWNTGHPGGIATIHANSAHSTYNRLVQLVEEAITHCPAELISEAIDYVIHITKDKKSSSGRKITEILQYCGYDTKNKTINIKEIFKGV